MHNIASTCPICQTTSRYGSELIGCYTLCPCCRNRFYIEVPPLGEGEPKPKWRSARITWDGAVPTTTLDDLLWDKQQGNRFVIQSLWRVEWRLKCQGYAIVALLALLLSILTRLVVP